MRILWISPWMRPLARIHCDILRAAGHEVLLITDNQHPEVTTAVPGERVVPMGLTNPRSWIPQLQLARAIRSFRPDVVVDELVRDPRVAVACGSIPLVHIRHDDRPHDAGEIDRNPAHRLLHRWRSRATVTIVFSHYVAEQVRGDVPGRVHVVPLTSDVTVAQVAAWAPETPVPAAQRRHFLMLGRINAYKNVRVVLAAFQAHRASPAFRGDDLIILGDGTEQIPHTAGVQWRRGAFSYRDVLSDIATAKGSVAHYRVASQSGVQVLASQLGVASLVSTAGGLAEFLPPGQQAVDCDDIAGLQALFDALADPDEAARAGQLSQAHYRDHHSPEAIAGALEAAVANAARAH